MSMIQSCHIKWPIKVTPGEEAVWISLLVSLTMIILTVLFLWFWSDWLENSYLDRRSFTVLENWLPALEADRWEVGA